MRISLHTRLGHLRLGMILMASDAFRNDFSGWTVARDAIRLCRHEQIRCLATSDRSMAPVAIQLFVGDRIDLMLRVIEARLRHPSIDQNRLGEYRRRVRDCLDVMTKCAAREVGANVGGHLALGFIRVGREEHGVL